MHWAVLSVNKSDQDGNKLVLQSLSGMYSESGKQAESLISLEECLTYDCYNLCWCSFIGFFVGRYNWRWIFSHQPTWDLILQNLQVWHCLTTSLDLPWTSSVWGPGMGLKNQNFKENLQWVVCISIITDPWTANLWSTVELRNCIMLLAFKRDFWEWGSKDDTWCFVLRYNWTSTY